MINLNQAFERFPRAKPMLVLTLLVLVLNVLTLRSVSHVSAIDEREHIDYLMRGSHGRIGQNGDTLTQETLRELCSRGSEIITVWPPCAPDLDPADFSPGGLNVSTDTPFYYLVDGVGARALRALTPGWESLVTWGRALNSLWLLVGFYLALRAGELLGVRRWPLVAGLVVVAAVPAQLHASTAVNTDATAFASGAAMLLAVLAWERRRRGLWIVAAAGALVVFEATNTLGLLIALGYLGLRALAAARGDGDTALPWRRYAAPAAALALGALVAAGTWEVASRQLSPPPRENTIGALEHREATEVLDPTRAFFQVDGVPWREILSAETVFAMLPPTVDVAAPAVRTTEPNATWYRLAATAASILLAGCLLAALFRFSLRDRVVILGVVTLGLLIVAAPVFNLYNYLANDYYDRIVPRFGLSALPAIAVVLAGFARTRPVQGVLAVVAVGLYGTALLTLA